MEAGMKTMPKFAHMSDIHVGAFRQPELKRLLLDAFDSAIDRCISEHVDFVIISGDIFDSNIPDLASVRRATKKMREAGDKGIRFYVVYGSHDFSPNFASMVDVLESAGLFVMAEKGHEDEGALKLDFVADPSGAKICGISGKKLSMDREDYDLLEKDELEAEHGFRIFVFHGAIEELKPQGLEMIEAMPVSSLPAGFNYYAGGHVHSRKLVSLPGRKNIAFPGPLFATEYSELSALASGEERGFYLIEFEEEVKEIVFVPIKVCEIAEIHYSAEGKSSEETSKGLMGLATDSNVKGKVVLLTVEGEISNGRTSDIDFPGIRKRLLSSSPLIILANYSHLTSKELVKRAGPPKPSHVTERELFEENITRVQSEEKELRGEPGVALSINLLQALKEEKKENENRSEYEFRTEATGLKILKLDGGS
jgi:DNA repair exonuclease SbcCD nuclease subunit